MLPAFLLLRSVYFSAASADESVEFAFRVEVANLGDAAGGLAAHEEDGELNGVCEAVKERGEDSFVSWRGAQAKDGQPQLGFGYEMERTSLVNLDVYG